MTKRLLKKKKDLLKKEKEELVQLLIESETREKMLENANYSLSVRLINAGEKLEIIEKRLRDTREEFLVLN